MHCSERVCAVKTPGPLRNRDFVTQRVWLDLGKEMMIFNHSVNHTVHPGVMLSLQGWANFSMHGPRGTSLQTQAHRTVTK